MKLKAGMAVKDVVDGAVGVIDEIMDSNEMMDARTGYVPM